MESSHIEVTPVTLNQFISSKNIVVLRVTMTTEIPFNRILEEQFTKRYFGTVRFGSMQLEGATAIFPNACQPLLDAFERIGLRKPTSLMPGYYLFRNGKMLAYDTGILDLKNYAPGMGWMMILIPAAVGLISGDLGTGLRSLVDTIEMATGTHMFHFFTQRLRFSAFGLQQRQQREVYNAGVMKAYSILGVPPTTSDALVKAAYIKLMTIHHPDKNPEKNFEECNRETARINEAYAIIVEDRKVKKATFA